MINAEFLDLRPADLEILAVTSVATPFDVILEDETTGQEIDVSVYNSFKMFIRKRPNAAPLATITGTRSGNTVTFIINQDLLGIHYYNIIYSNTGNAALVFAPLAGMVNFQNTQK
jgi:hypothetical protein